MHLKTLNISNFRAIKSIDVEFNDGINVIVGPNAIGKTTILEGIRLAKALLSQRTSSEAQQTLVSLGASSPQTPQQLIPDGLVQDAAEPLEVRCGYELQDTELTEIASGQQQIVTNIVQSRVQGQVNPTTFAAFLSSPEGKSALQSASREVDAGIQKVRQSSRVVRLDLTIDFRAGRINTPDPVGAALISFLDSRLPPDTTKFSYFPADRALPRGEVPVQLGAQDASQQLESHNSQPQLKYNRLKNTIFNTIIANEQGREVLAKEFETIFGGILKGRELVGAGLNQYGLLSIKIRDKDSGRIFDIDGLSSGEKGLVLTFLLIGRASAQDGIVLLDEPELHLNPAVCRDLLPFAVENYVIPKNLQLIICSHSPEILAGAFDSERCSLFHLKSGSRLSAVRRSDEAEVTEALRLLGTSESEGLLYRATIFVEGEHDVELLELGFGSILRQFKLKDLGGRQEVEKQIRLLQKAEEGGDQLTPRYFIFDKDEVPSQLQSTTMVKVLQWNRRCLENYLLDLDVLADLLKDSEITRTPLQSSGEVGAMLKELAMQQLEDVVIRDVYESYAFNNVGRRPTDVSGKSFKEAAESLFDRIEVVKGELCSLTRDEWTTEYERKAVARKAELRPIWDISWREIADGKRLFRDLQGRANLKMSLFGFKKRVMSRMRSHPPSESWRAIESLLQSLIANNTTV